MQSRYLPKAGADALPKLVAAAAAPNPPLGTLGTNAETGRAPNPRAGAGARGGADSRER